MLPHTAQLRTLVDLLFRRVCQCCCTLQPAGKKEIGKAKINSKLINPCLLAEKIYFVHYRSNLGSKGGMLHLSRCARIQLHRVCKPSFLFLIF